MIILVATSYARKYISQKVWRTIHFLNIALYIFSIIHAFYLGTDLKTGHLAGNFHLGEWSADCAFGVQYVLSSLVEDEKSTCNL